MANTRGVRGRAIIALGIFVLALLAIHDLAKLGGSLPWNRTIDLPEFYCAGSALTHREDPYLASVLRGCEHSIKHGGDWSYASYVVPAPQPPFDFLPYAILSLLSFRQAQIAVTLLIAAALVGTAWSLSRLGVPLIAGLAALAMGDAFVGMFTAQIYPFEVLLLALAALALARRRDALAGIVAALTLIEPQIGIATCLALLVWAPRARLPLVATALLMAMAGIAAVGFGPAVEWARFVIPSQARAEAAFWAQYSLTSVLTGMGVGTTAAVLVGSISFVAMLLLGLWIAGRLARLSDSRELLVLLPAAFSVIAGTYVHLDAIAVAVPLALLLATGRYRVPMYASIAVLLLLAIPWLYAQEFKPLYFSCLLCVALLCVALKPPVLQTASILAACAAGLYLIALHTPPALSLVHEAMPANNAIATQWIVRTAFDPWRTFAKLPTWIGLAGLVAVAIYALRSSQERDAKKTVVAHPGTTSA